MTVCGVWDECVVTGRLEFQYLLSHSCLYLITTHDQFITYMYGINWRPICSQQLSSSWLSATAHLARISNQQQPTSSLSPVSGSCPPFPASTPSPVPPTTASPVSMPPHHHQQHHRLSSPHQQGQGHGQQQGHRCHHNSSSSSSSQNHHQASQQHQHSPNGSLGPAGDGTLSSISPTTATAPSSSGVPSTPTKNSSSRNSSSTSAGSASSGSSHPRYVFFYFLNSWN